MKTKTLFAVLLLLAFSQSKASPSLAPEEAEHFKERAHDMLVDYYASLPLLVGVKMPDDQKEEIALKLITYNFRSPSATVFNDYQKNANIKELPIKEYLGQLNALYYDEKLGITFTDPIVTVNGVYMAGDSFLVKTVVEWSLVSAGKPELNTTSTIDYYFSFSPGVEDIRVYRMTDHRDNISKLVPAEIQSKAFIGNDATASINPSQEVNRAFFTFKVSPSNAIVNVDGQPLYYINGLKRATVTGTRKIEITAPGYEPYVLTNFNVKEGDNIINAELTENMGTLSVEPNKKNQGASIVIDGKTVGIIPMARLPLREGLHSIQIVKEGYFGKRKNIKIVQNKDETWKPDIINIENTKRGVNTALMMFGIKPLVPTGGQNTNGGNNGNGVGGYCFENRYGYFIKVALYQGTARSSDMFVAGINLYSSQQDCFNNLTGGNYYHYVVLDGNNNTITEGNIQPSAGQTYRTSLY